MAAKLFDRSLKKSCLWCAYGKKSEYTNEVFCIKRGVTYADSYCRKYKYDPLKRTPDNKTISKDYNADSFSL
ncbi:MAG: hypothetical protein IKZ59_06065 [Clostridia bacterium]|nr:hypothetical protein [Clostridia bacterium]